MGIIFRPSSDDFGPIGEEAPTPCPPRLSSSLAQNLCNPYEDTDRCSVPPSRRRDDTSPIYQSGRPLPPSGGGGGLPLLAVNTYTVILRQNLSAGFVTVSMASIHTSSPDIQSRLERLFGSPGWTASTQETRWRMVTTPFDTELDHYSATSPPADDLAHPQSATRNIEDPDPGFSVEGLAANFRPSTDVVMSAVEFDLTPDGTAVGSLVCEIYLGGLVPPAADPPPALTLLASSSVPVGSMGTPTSFPF